MTRDEFDAWATQNRQELVRIALSRTSGDRQRAEDAVQAALLRAYETGNYESCRGKMLTWVMQAVKSALSTGRRSEKRHRASRRDAAVMAEFGEVPGVFRTYLTSGRQASRENK